MDRTAVNYTTADTGTATLTRAVPRVDATTQGTQQWDLDLTSGVVEADAEHVAPALPQVTEYLARARDGQGSAQVTVKPTQRDLRLQLYDSDGGAVLLEASAEIRHLRMHLTEKAQTYTARLRVYGLTPEQGAALVRQLGQPLQVHAAPLQQAFEFDGPALGSLVTGDNSGEDVYGILTRRTDAGLVIDNFGLVHTVPTTKAAIVLAEGWEAKAEQYAQAVRDGGGAPTWRSVIAALAAVGDGTTLDDAVVEQALAYHLPPEAGAGSI